VSLKSSLDYLKHFNEQHTRPPGHHQCLLFSSINLSLDMFQTCNYHVLPNWTLFAVPSLLWWHCEHRWVRMPWISEQVGIWELCPIFCILNLFVSTGTFFAPFPIFLLSVGGVRPGPLVTSATVGLLYRPRIIDDDYGAVGGMRIGRGNRRTRRKPAPVPLYPPQIPHDLTWDQTQAAAMGIFRS
jgi:hypothetical protein